MGVLGLRLGSVPKITLWKMGCLHVNYVFDKIISYSGIFVCNLQGKY